MTRDEILEYFKDVNHAYNDCTRYDTLKRMLDELQEPCDDVISRQAVTDTTICEGISCNECSFNTCEDGQSGCLLKERVDKLPSVKPQYTEAEIQKMQDLESVEIQTAYEIGKAENPNKWIPVSERLPEWHWEIYGDEKVWDGERVLACVKEADEYYDLVGVAKYGPHGWESEDEGFCSCWESKPVIAWMPLPEPYKEG